VAEPPVSPQWDPGHLEGIGTARSGPGHDGTGPVSPSRVPRHAILVVAVTIGVAADLLLIRAPGGPGLNLLLLFVLLAAAVHVATRGAGFRCSPEARGWIAGALLLATAFVLRASPALHVTAFLSASAAFAFPALRAGGAWVRRCGVSHPLEAIAGAILFSALGPLRLGWKGTPGFATHPGPDVGAPGDVPPTDRHLSPAPLAGAILRGLLLSLPFLLVFGGLFLSADPVFAGIVTEVLGFIDLEEVVSHLLVVGILAWLAAGYLTGVVRGTGVRRWLPPVGVPCSLRIVEGATALALVNLLFAAFVGVQFHTLFGGSTLVEVTPGLTYAEYAREGFAQLLWAVGLVLPSLLGLDWALRHNGPREARIFRALGGIQILLLGFLILSAAERVRIYQVAYGLTESRFYGAAFLAWFSFLAAWFAATVLRGRRDRFAAVALLSGFFLVGGLLVVNPDAWIARTNLARAMDRAVELSGDEGAATLDVSYLGTLSADAAPVLLRSLGSLPPEDACALSLELWRRWGGAGPGDWRNWNRAEAQARRLVGTYAGDALGIDATPGCPPG
jgi:hypothetical protein